MKKIGLLQTRRTMWGTYNFPHIHHVKLSTSLNVTWLLLVSLPVLNLIVGTFVLIAPLSYTTFLVSFSLSKTRIYTLFRIFFFFLSVESVKEGATRADSVRILPNSLSLLYLANISSSVVPMIVCCTIHSYMHTYVKLNTNELIK